jgi:hypothetical protein
MQTVRHARIRLRVARTALGRLEPHLLNRPIWTIYPRHAGGFAGTGR